MKRRTLLQLASVSSLGLLAGCTGEGPGTGPGDGTDEPSDSTDTQTASPTESSTESPTESPTPTTSPSNGEFASSFTVTNNECGTAKNSAEGSADGSTVTITGVITGSDACYSAKLADATVEDGALEVAVASYVPPENEGKACADCVVDISYEATFEFDGSTPDRAVVAHDGERVAEFSLDG